jgi:hypothetical protein
MDTDRAGSLLERWLHNGKVKAEHRTEVEPPVSGSEASLLLHRVGLASAFLTGRGLSFFTASDRAPFLGCSFSSCL